MNSNNNSLYCESCATDFLAFTDCLGSIDAAFDTYDPIGNEFSLIAAARIACTAYAVTLTADQGALRVPKSYRQAMSSPQAEQWREAINKELSGLVALDIWDLVPLSLPFLPPPMLCTATLYLQSSARPTVQSTSSRLALSPTATLKNIGA